MAEHGGAWQSMGGPGGGREEHGGAWGGIGGACQSMGGIGGAWGGVAEHGGHGGAWQKQRSGSSPTESVCVGVRVCMRECAMEGVGHVCVVGGPILCGGGGACTWCMCERA